MEVQHPVKSYYNEIIESRRIIFMGFKMTASTAVSTFPWTDWKKQRQCTWSPGKHRNHIVLKITSWRLKSFGEVAWGWFGVGSSQRLFQVFSYDSSCCWPHQLAYSQGRNRRNGDSFNKEEWPDILVFLLTRFSEEQSDILRKGRMAKALATWKFRFFF